MGADPTQELRRVQAQLNAFIDEVCTSPDTGNEVIDICNLLGFLVGSGFRWADNIYELLADAQGTALGSYYNALMALDFAAHFLRCGNFSPEQLEQAVKALMEKSRQDQSYAQEEDPCL